MPMEMKTEQGAAVVISIEPIQLHPNPSQNVIQMTNEPNLAVKREEKPNPFARSSFLEAGIVADTLCNDGSIVTISEQPLVFSSARPIQPSRQDTLTKGLALQTQTPEIYLDLSQKIVEMVSQQSNLTMEGTRVSGQTSEITQIVAQLIREFVVKTFEPTRFNFVTGPPSSSISLSSLKLTPEFYASILPINVVDVAAQQIVQRNRAHPIYHCIGRKKSSKTQERCKLNSKYDKVAFGALFKELSSIPKPRDLFRVVKLLSDLVNMLYCGRYHLDDPERNLNKIRTHFMGDSTPVKRKADLESFVLWVTQLERAYQRETGTEATASSIVSASDQMAVITSDIAALDTGRTVMDFTISKATISSQDVACHRTYYDGSQTLQRYYKDPKMLTLKDAQIMSRVQALAKKPITGKDLSAKGCIYIFRHSTSIGYHKIGYSQDVGLRLKNWAESCKYVVDQRADLLDRIDRVACHPHRLEQLIHTELITKRYKVVECGCDDQIKHKEWFEIDANYAQKVIAKWTFWMQQNPSPYDEKGEFRGDTELPPLGIEGHTYFDDVERRSSQMAQEQVRTRRTFGRDSDDISRVEAPAASTHSMILRSDGRSRKRASET